MRRSPDGTMTPLTMPNHPTIKASPYEPFAANRTSAEKISSKFIAHRLIASGWLNPEGSKRAE